MTNPKPTHTPTPWRVFESNQTPFPVHHVLCDDVISGLATMTRGSATENAANAAHIVKCVNLHDGLTWHLAETIELLEMQLKHDLKLSEGARTAIEGRVRVKKDLLNRAKGQE